MRPILVTRRGACLAIVTLPLSASAATAQASAAPRSCTAPAPRTRAQTEGPYFKRNAPARADLAKDDSRGERFRLRGTVLGGDCLPISGAIVDLWQTDSSGAYDNAGYRLRGHQITAADGSFAFDTVVPGLYPGRTRHLHIKIVAPGRPVLTTQLYFPGEPGNATDRIFDASLLMTVMKEQGMTIGRYSFVLG